jgi:hypothetical protein
VSDQWWCHNCDWWPCECGDRGYRIRQFATVVMANWFVGVIVGIVAPDNPVMGLTTIAAFTLLTVEAFECGVKN